TRGPRAPAEYSGHPKPWYGGEGRSARDQARVDPSGLEGSPSAGAHGRGARRPARPSLPLDQRTVLAHEEVEVRPLLVRKLEKDLLALGIFEALAVLLEEAMRAALAADANHERLLIVDAFHQPLGALGKEAVGGALEEQERGARLELGIASQQLVVALLELAEMLLLLESEVVEDLPSARI